MSDKLMTEQAKSAIITAQLKLQQAYHASERLGPSCPNAATEQDKVAIKQAEMKLYELTNRHE